MGLIEFSLGIEAFFKETTQPPGRDIREARANS
jgi:hypothetical protein